MSAALPSVEQHVSHAIFARLAGNRCRRWAIKEIQAGNLGDAVVKDGKDYLIPESAVARWFASRRAVFSFSGGAK